MTFYKKIPFSFNDKAYEIRILHDAKLINMVAFYQNYPANGFRYHIQIPNKTDIQSLLRMENLSHLIDMAKDDILQDRWKKFIS